MDKAFVIAGEASESDDDEKVVLSVPIVKKKENSSLINNKGIIVSGEASESESESEDTFREAFFARSGATENELEDDNQHSQQYDTLLHSKLRECNASLDQSVCSQSREPLVSAVRAVNWTNQQLLATQLRVQDAATALARATDHLTRLSYGLDVLLATPYIPDTNIV